MPVTFKFEDGTKLAKKFRTSTTRYSEAVIQATQYAAKQAQATIEEEGRADIRAGGNFSSSRWQDGFRAKLSYLKRYDIVIRVTHAVSYWKVFEFGAIIKGKPLLWIPLSFARDALKVRARDYPGPLFRVDRKNGKAPLLLTTGGVPKYFGKESVKIPKKFHLRAVVRRNARRMKAWYREGMKNVKRRK